MTRIKDRHIENRDLKKVAIEAGLKKLIQDLAVFHQKVMNNPKPKVAAVDIWYEQTATDFQARLGMLIYDYVNWCKEEQDGQ